MAEVSPEAGDLNGELECYHNVERNSNFFQKKW